MTPDRKLGCRRSVADPRTLMLSRFMPSPEPPPAVNLHEKVSLAWGQMGNDKIGDCVFAAPGHLEMIWTGNRGHLYRPSDQSIVDAYADVTGYDPAWADANGNNPTDQGCEPIRMLKAWKKDGIAQHKIGAYGALNPKDAQRLKQSVFMLEGVFLGLSLPYAAGDLVDWDIPAGQSLTDVWEPGSWGGHAVCSGKYDPEWLYLVTWGTVVRASWRFVCTYADEAWGCVSEDMLNITEQVAPNGLNIAGLTAALEAIT